MMAALTIAAGCGTGPTPDRSAQRARTITIATSVFPSSINEYVAQTRSLDTAFHYFMLYMPLAAEQADFEDGPATLKPRLARSWSFSEDHRVLTFLLRDDARWSDGTPITADDVRFTWQAQTSPEVGWSGAGTKAGITDVEAVDAYTVRFHYREPYANQLVDAVQGVIVPAHVWRELPLLRGATSGHGFASMRCRVDPSFSSAGRTASVWCLGAMSTITLMTCQVMTH